MRTADGPARMEPVARGLTALPFPTESSKTNGRRCRLEDAVGLCHGRARDEKQRFAASRFQPVTPEVLREPDRIHGEPGFPIF